MKDLMTDKEGVEPKKKKNPKQPQQRNIIKEKEENTNPLARVFGDMHRLNVFLESRQQSLDTHISQSLHQQHKHTHTIHKLHQGRRNRAELEKKAPPNESNSVQMKKSQKVKEIGGKCLNQCWRCWPVLSFCQEPPVPVLALSPNPFLFKIHGRKFCT